MPRILLIDDDPNLVELLSEYLKNQDYLVSSAGDGREGLRKLFQEQPDLVLLDVTMPGKNGWQTLERIREISDLPVIMLTARSEEVDILHGFSLGADDYITKPFSFAQLAARVRAVLARTQGHQTEYLQAGDLHVDMLNHKVYRGKTPIPLTPTEFKLLVSLMKHQGTTLSPEDLVREVWGPQYTSEVGNVRRYIWHLRQKIEPDPKNPTYIHNEHGYGYRFQPV